MEEVFEKIIKSFGLSPKNYSKQKLGVYIETDDSTKIIKKTPATRNQIIFSHLVKEHLFSVGFKNIDRYSKSVHNLPFVSLDNANYIMTDAYLSDLECINVNDQQELNYITKQLATMHDLFSKKIFSAQIPSFNKISIETTDYYKKRMAELNHIKKWIDEQSHLSDFDVLFIKNYKYYLKRINTAYELSKKINYSRLKEKILKEKNFAHNAFKEQNIKKDLDNSIFILNFENASYASNITDFASLIKNYIKKETFNQRFLDELFYTYKEINDISADELLLLKTMLIYPSKYNKLVNYHYNKRRTWISDTSKSRLQICLSQNENYELAIKQILHL